MKVLVILAHPRVESLNGALAAAYAEAAAESAEVRQLNLAELEFDLNLHVAYADNKAQPLEPGLQRAQADIRWADHLVFVYPSWWGTMPALLKGFIDRTFLPGFAFRYQQGKAIPDKLLKGKTARLMVTMDTPSWWNRFVYRAAGHNAMKHAVLKFSGVSPVKLTEFAGVRGSSPAKRERWLQKAKRIGAQDTASALKIKAQVFA